jgi:hypothetical protein
VCFWTWWDISAPKAIWDCYLTWNGEIDAILTEINKLWTSEAWPWWPPAHHTKEREHDSKPQANPSWWPPGHKKQAAAIWMKSEPEQCTKKNIFQQQSEEFSNKKTIWTAPASSNLGEAAGRGVGWREATGRGAARRATVGPDVGRTAVGMVAARPTAGKTTAGD